MGKRIRDLADKMRRGEWKGTPKEEAEDRADAALCGELAQLIRKNVMLPWLAAHPDVDFTVVAPAIISVAAVHCMAQAEMSPDDFAEMARFVAEEFKSDAAAIRKQALARGEA